MASAFCAPDLQPVGTPALGRDSDERLPCAWPACRLQPAGLRAVVVVVDAVGCCLVACSGLRSTLTRTRQPSVLWQASAKAASCTFLREPCPVHEPAVLFHPPRDWPSPTACLHARWSPRGPSRGSPSPSPSPLAASIWHRSGAHHQSAAARQADRPAGIVRGLTWLDSLCGAAGRDGVQATGARASSTIWLLLPLHGAHPRRSSRASSSGPAWPSTPRAEQLSHSILACTRRHRLPLGHDGPHYSTRPRAWPCRLQMTQIFGRVPLGSGFCIPVKLLRSSLI